MRNYLLDPHWTEVVERGGSSQEAGCRSRAEGIGSESSGCAESILKWVWFGIADWSACFETVDN